MAPTLRTLLLLACAPLSAAAQVPLAPGPAPEAQPPAAEPLTDQRPAVGATAPSEPGGAAPSQQGLGRFFELTDLRGGLTSDQVAERAVKNSALIEQRRASALAASAREDEALAGLWPRLTLSARYTRLSDIQQPNLSGDGGSLVASTVAPGQVVTPADPLVGVGLTFPVLLDNYELKATLSVPLSDYVYRTGTAIAAAEHSAESARHAEEAAQRQVAAEARLAYYDWVRSLGQRIVAEEALRNMQARERDASVLADAGRLSRAELLGAKAQTKNAQVTAVQAQHFARITEERLRTITYDTSKTPYKVGEDLRQGLGGAAPTQDTDALVREAQGQRSEFLALDQSVQSMEGLESLARSEGHPRLDLTGNYIYANPNQRLVPQTDKWTPSWDVSLVLSWTPTDLARTHAVTSQQAARVAELRAQRRSMVEGLRLEVTQAVQGVEEADATLASAHEALLAAEESYRGRRELFQSGQGSLTDLNDAEVLLTRARLGVVNAQIDARTSRVRLDHALGRDVISEQ